MWLDERGIHMQHCENDQLLLTRQVKQPDERRIKLGMTFGLQNKSTSLAHRPPSRCVVERCFNLKTPPEELDVNLCALAHSARVWTDRV